MEETNAYNSKAMIDVEMLERLCSLRVPGEVYQVFMVILCRTYGVGMNKNLIKPEEFSNLTGLRQQNVCRALQTLKKMGIIDKQRVKLGSYFSINKNPKKWQEIINTDKKIIINIDKSIINTDKAVINIDKNNSSLENNLKINENSNKNDTFINIDKNIENNSKINENLISEKDDEISYCFNNIYNNIYNTYNINEKSLLKSSNSSKRILGYFCFQFKQKFGTDYKLSFGKDMAIVNRIFAMYGELKTLLMINAFYSKNYYDTENWITLEMFESQCNKLVVRISGKKEIEKKVEEKTIIEEKKEIVTEKKYATVKFDVMMADLKKQYGSIRAIGHIQEYQNQWKNELTKLVKVLKNLTKF